MRRLALWQALTLILTVLPGCYLPDPADLPTITPGEQIRLLLSEDGIEHLQEISAETLGEVNGRFQSLTEDSVTITTRLSRPAYAGPTLGNLRQILTFARADILEVSVPKLDRVRTTIVVGGIVVAAAFLVPGFFKLIGNSQGPDDPPDPTPFRIRR
ncbi:MAG TPA: hypothetical protein EYO83_11950 [Gemmatimonadetes bacterium]|nr:hypothetical protein [Gemmatimonadota bacterium]